MHKCGTILDELRESLEDSLRRLYQIDPVEIQPALSPAADLEFGDYMSNAAFVLSKKLKKKPIEIAGEIAGTFSGPASAEPAGPGFINFKISRARLLANLGTADDEAWRSADTGGGRKINIEFVSANPTGPLHVGHGRGAVIGDTIARLFAESGYAVTREYYVNDIGKQIAALGESLLAAAAKKLDVESSFTETYQVGEIVDEFIAQEGLSSETDSAYPLDAASAFAKKRMLSRIMATLERLGIGFDSVVSESSFKAAVPALIARLTEKELLYDADEAECDAEKRRRADSKSAAHKSSMEGGTFLRTSRFGDETDRVILRKNGTATYFTTDIIYHEQKHARGFDRMVNVWGADHGGHVKRLKSALEAIGAPSEKLDVVLCQMVRLVRGGEEVKMSKRAGTVIALDDLIDEVGADPVRFFFLSRSPSAQFDFDLDLAVKKSADNPVFYCQYAHARTCQLLLKGQEHGFAPSAAAIETLADPVEVSILRNLITIPETVRSAAEKLEPHRLVEAAMNLAAEFHRYQTAGKERDELRIIRPEERAVSEARLLLVSRVGAAMRKLLSLMGVSAPERM